MSRGALAALLALLLVAGCGDDPPPPVDAAGEPAQQTPTQQVAEAVDTERVELGQVEVRIAASGSIEARRVSEIAPEISGRIIEVSVEVGDEVEEGEVLFRIDPGPYELALAEARAGLALASAESRNADDEAERAAQLKEQRAASQARLEQLQTAAAVARARVDQMQAQLGRAQRDLAQSQVRAPYRGSVVERRAHEGAMVAGAVVVLQESGALEAHLDVPEAAAAPVRAGDPVSLLLEGVADPIESVVSAVSRRVDADTRTYSARVPIEDPQGIVKAGSFVRAEITPRGGEPRPTVAREALLLRDGQRYVFRVAGDRVERRTVRVGRINGERVEILRGVEVGDVVVRGEVVRRLGDGAPIRLADRAAGPETAGR